MAEYEINVVSLPEIKKHPNADRLGVAEISGYQVVVNDQWKEGDLAIYIEPDFVVPEIPQFSFLGSRAKNRRIRPKKLRGIWSEGLLIPVSEFEENLVEGQNVFDLLGFERYDPESPKHNPGTSHVTPEKDTEPPVLSPKYGLLNYKKFSHLLMENEAITVTEKIHGSNARYVYIKEEEKLYIGCRNIWVKDTFKKVPQVAVMDTIAGAVVRDWCRANPGIVLYGEVYGQQRGFPYDTAEGSYSFASFDAWNGREFLPRHGLPLPAPTLYIGPYNHEVVQKYVDGESKLNSSHIREGVVIKLFDEREDPEEGRLAFKFVSNDYLALK